MSVLQCLLVVVRAYETGLVCEPSQWPDITDCYAPASYVRHIATDHMRIPGRLYCHEHIIFWNQPRPVDVRIEALIGIVPYSDEHIKMEAAFYTLAGAL